MKRKVCNFSVPSPFVVLSSKGLKRNEYVKYIIYPSLDRFKKACSNCPYIRRVNNHFECEIRDSDFMLKYYSIGVNVPRGVYLGVGGVPPYLKTHSLRLEIESFLDRGGQSQHKQRVNDFKLGLSVADGKTSCFGGVKSKPSPDIG